MTVRKREEQLPSGSSECQDQAKSSHGLTSCVLQSFSLRQSSNSSAHIRYSHSLCRKDRIEPSLASRTDTTSRVFHAHGGDFQPAASRNTLDKPQYALLKLRRRHWRTSSNSSETPRKIQRRLSIRNICRHEITRRVTSATRPDECKSRVKLLDTRQRLTAISASKCSSQIVREVRRASVQDGSRTTSLASSSKVGHA